MRTRRSRSSSDLMSSKVEGHQPVLLHEALEYLEMQKNDTVVDATLGGAGHATAIAALLGNEGALIGFDIDQDAISRAEAALKDVAPKTLLINANFRDVRTQLATHNISHISKALFDLGWSGYQLDAGRGFSFLRDEPLLMTYSKEMGAVNASVIVNEWAEESIADIIFGWGEERYSRRIAKAIIEARSKKRIETSRELAEIVKMSTPPGYRYGRIHPATKTFQALRIAVNDELGALTEGLRGTWQLLSPGGRMAVITFHSIEDRLVKNMFRDWEKSGTGERVNRSVIIAKKEELAENPRARSAKLRVIQKK